MLHSYTRELLFHYTSRATAIEKILGSLTFRMGSMKATNDPRETDPWFFGFTMDDENRAPNGEEFFEVTRTLDESLKKSCLVACLTHDAPDPHPELGDPDHYVRFDLGLQGYAHDRMWAQYAGNHTGVCIFFDRERLTHRMNEHFHGRYGRLLYGPVDYLRRVEVLNSPFHDLSWKELRETGIEAYAKRHSERFAHQLYLTKNPDWASELEYRFVWIDEQEHENQEEYIPIDGCVKAICVGARFPKVYKVNIRAIKEQLDIEIHQILYNYGQLAIGPLL